MTAGDLARLSGVNRSTVFRALSDQYEFVPSSRTLDRLSIALVDAAAQKGLAKAAAAPDPYRDFMQVDLETAVGYWQPLDVSQPWSGSSPLVYLERVARGKQFAAHVSRVEASVAYRAGDLLHVLQADVLGVITASVGDHLLVSRRSSPEVAHTTVMEVMQLAQDGQALLRAPTDGRRLKEIAIPLHAQVDLEGFSYAVEGLIVAMHRKMHYMAR